MDSKKRAIAVSLIVIVILFAIWVSRTNVEKARGPLKSEQVALKGASEKEAAVQSPEPQPAEELIQEEVAEVQEVPEVEVPDAPAPAAAGGKCKPESAALAKKRAAAAPEGMVYVSAGAFTMGNPAGQQNSDDSPARLICLNGFYIDKYEVTNAQFKQFVDETGYLTDAEKGAAGSGVLTWRNPYGPDSSFEDMLSHPVVCVSWTDANAYAQWAGKRLPTEAEWEKAARGNDGRLFPWGNAHLPEAALNVADKSVSSKWSSTAVSDGYKTAAPVGSFPGGKSVYGAEDMAGNVWEWCADWWDSEYYKTSPSDNPMGPSEGEYRVIRGGSWFYHLEGARTTQRMYFRPDGNSSAIGFRCVSEVD